MAWNRPSGETAKTPPRRRVTKAVAPNRRGGVYLAAALVGALAVIGIFCLTVFRRPAATEETAAPTATPAEPAPTAPEAKDAPPEIGSEEFRKLPKEERLRLRVAARKAARGTAEEHFPTNWQYKGGRQQDAPEVAEMRRRFPFPEIPFKNPAEVALHGLLNATGDGDYDERRFDARFIAQLRESYATEIVIAEDDDEIVREEKRAMIDLKARLKPYLALGETGEKEIIRLLNEEQAAIRDAEDTRRDFVKQLREAEREGATGEELDTLREAANRILQEKGASPIRATVAETMRRRIERMKDKKGANE